MRDVRVERGLPPSPNLWRTDWTRFQDQPTRPPAGFHLGFDQLAKLVGNSDGDICRVEPALTLQREGLLDQLDAQGGKLAVEAIAGSGRHGRQASTMTLKPP